MAATVSTMVLRALKMTGEKQIGATLTSTEQTYYLSAVNALLESWSLEGLLVYEVEERSHALTSGTGTYTIGDGGVISGARPTRIVSPCWIRDSDSADSPVQVIDQNDYGLLVEKTLDGSYPQYLYYQTSYPLGVIKLYPEPQAGLTLYFSSWKALPAFGAIGQTVALPPGYQRAIESNLAIELSPGQLPVSQEVIKIARESKAALKSGNSRIPTLKIDSMFSGRRMPGSNIFTGA